jgi:hypothetical protein
MIRSSITPPATKALSLAFDLDSALLRGPVPARAIAVDLAEALRVLALHAAGTAAEDDAIMAWEASRAARSILSRPELEEERPGIDSPLYGSVLSSIDTVCSVLFNLTGTRPAYTSH